MCNREKEVGNKRRKHRTTSEVMIELVTNRRYQPKISIAQYSSSNITEKVASFVFPETAFFAVTYFHSDQVTVPV
jgi:hypothetical protein